LQSRKARFWAVFCVAVWMTGTAAMAVVATQNFWTIDRLLTVPPNSTFAADIEKLGRDSTRALLYYYSSELNRLYFQYWNLAQLAIGVLALWLVVKVPYASQPKWGIVAMLAIVLFLTVLVTPPILSVGRSLDFVPRVPPPEGLRTFGLLHSAYAVFDGIVMILGILVTVWLNNLKD
jgi:hypothetical protein